jgi:hypothetical protein
MIRLFTFPTLIKFPLTSIAMLSVCRFSVAKHNVPLKILLVTLQCVISPPSFLVSRKLSRNKINSKLQVVQLIHLFLLVSCIFLCACVGREGIEVSLLSLYIFFIYFL